MVAHDLRGQKRPRARSEPASTAPSSRLTVLDGLGGLIESFRGIAAVLNSLSTV